MATEDQALDFLLRLQTGPFSSATKKVVGGLDLIANAAERAHESLNEGRKSIADRLKEAFSKSGLSPLVLRSVSRGLGLVGLGLRGLTRFVGDSVERWKENYLGVIAWRREVGMTQEDVSDLSSQLIGATARYGFALDRAVTIARRLSEGATNARGSLAEMAAQLLEIERHTGASAESLADLESILVRNQKVMGPGEFQNVLYSMRLGLQGTRVPLQSFIESLTKNSEIFFRYSKESIPSLIRGLLELRIGWARATQDVETFDDIVGQLAQEGQLDNLLRAYTDPKTGVMNLSALFDMIGKSAEGLGNKYKDLTGLAENYGLGSARVLIALRDAAGELRRSGVGSIDAYDEALRRSGRKNLELIRSNATMLERMRQGWEDLGNAIAGVQSSFFTFIESPAMRNFMGGVLSFVGQVEGALLRISKTFDALSGKGPAGLIGQLLVRDVQRKGASLLDAIGTTYLGRFLRGVSNLVGAPEEKRKGLAPSFRPSRLSPGESYPSLTPPLRPVEKVPPSAAREANPETSMLLPVLESIEKGIARIDRRGLLRENRYPSLSQRRDGVASTGIDDLVLEGLA
jgi:hypothetical protein